MGKGIKLTIEEFISRGRAIHGDKFGYEKAIYIDSKTYLTIKCPEHGYLLQTPHRHFRGYGCTECGNAARAAKCGVFMKNIHRENGAKDFPRKARIVHKGKYKYKKFIYKNGKEKGIITCPKHGDFAQTPFGHLSGRGCSKCARAITLKALKKAAKKMTLQARKEFVPFAKMIHDNKYRYDMSTYVNQNHKMVVICPNHGGFKQTPAGHLNGNGCSKCAREAVIARAAKRFKEKAKLIHGSRYEYNKFNYTGYRKKGMVTCKFHGDFEQAPQSHLRGAGCKKCSKKKAVEYWGDIMGKRMSKSMKICFVNLTHGTSTKAFLREGVKGFSKRVMKRVQKDLCGVEGCSCRRWDETRTGDDRRCEVIYDFGGILTTERHWKVIMT
jgi:hypothetical protein